MRALAQLKQSNPPVASSRLVAVSAVAVVAAVFVCDGATRRSGNGLFLSPLICTRKAGCFMKCVHWDLLPSRAVIIPLPDSELRCSFDIL